jgi:cyclase
MMKTVTHSFVSRRSFLTTAVGGVGLCAAPSLFSNAVAATNSSSAIQFTALGERLHFVMGAGGNVLVAQTGDGLVMIDSGTAASAKDLLQQLNMKFGVTPIKALFNTHWHLQHTGGNDLLAKQGAVIIAHENTKLWMSTEIISRWENRTYPARATQALPTKTFIYDAKPYLLGNREVEYGYLPQAHTDGDIYIRFAEENVIVAGDVVTGGMYPILDYSSNGWLGGMAQGLKLLLQKADAQTRIVPGSGPLRTRADLQSQLEMCTTVLGRINESYYKGQSWNEFVASAPTREFDAKWGSPDLFLQTAYTGAWGHITEIRRFL